METIRPFDRVTVISIDPERLALLDLPDYLGGVDQVVGVLGDDLSLPMLPKDAGCRASHLRALEDFLSSTDSTMLVLEDDAVLTCSEDELLRLLSVEWDVVQLGGASPSGVFHGEARTHAYAVNRTGATVLHRFAVTMWSTTINKAYARAYPAVRTRAARRRLAVQR